jgi:hypothetical protein
MRHCSRREHAQTKRDDELVKATSGEALHEA